MRARRTTVLATALAAALAVAALASPARADDLVGTAADDVLIGTEGSDRIDARGGADRVFGEAGRDTLFGEEGDDDVRGGEGRDLVHGGPGADTLQGGRGQDWLFLEDGDTGDGGRGEDVLRAGEGAVTAAGGEGDDRIEAHGSGRHLLYGDEGDDRIFLEDQLGAATEAYGGPGNDEVAAEVDEVTGTAVVTLLAGGEGDDVVSGDAEQLSGGDGNDRLNSFGAPGTQQTSVSCGAGEDTATSFNRTDVFDADCETVVMNLVVGDGQPFVGTQYDDWVFGGALDETVLTLEGDDQVQDGVGSDTVALGPGDDFFENWSTHDEGDVDDVSCGDGVDTVFVHRTDVVAADCETVNYFDTVGAGPAS